MRLIDADALMAKMRREFMFEKTDFDKTMFYVEKSIIEQHPTIDAVPVCRCKDCEHWSDDAIGDECKCMYWKGLFDYCKPDDFCSYGKRKDGEG